MSKQVLVISASPRKGGNSDTLCDEFIRGAEAAGNRTEKIFLCEKNIHYCTGCGYCNSAHKCSQQDDMAEILNKMVSADVIVLASPVYFYTVDGQMKTMIDRSCPRYTEIAGKEFYYILTAADNSAASLERAVSGLRGFTLDCLPGTREQGILLGTGVWEKGAVKTTSFMKQAYDMGHNI